MDITAFLRLALAEDLGSGDVTTDATVPAAAQGEGLVLAKSPAVLSGLDLILPTFELLAPGRVTVALESQDGAQVAAGTSVAKVRGPLRALLSGERVMLNLLMHLSGVATLTRTCVDALGSKTKLLDTRKTLPGLRWLEKRAVRHGGGHNHRHGLADGILIKDNHIAAAGSIAKAVTSARAAAHHLLKIECEIATLAQIEEALGAGAEILLLDNMDNGTLRQAVTLVAGRALTEASGNMSLGRLGEIAKTGVDFVSMGALTHSAPAADLSMKVRATA